MIIDMRICTIALLMLSILVLSAQTYKLDLERGTQLRDLPPKVPAPSRATIHVTGPGKGIDRARYDKLAAQTPSVSITNSADLVELMSVLRNGDTQPRIPNVSKHSGCTYHLLLYYETDKTVLHVKIFEALDLTTEWSYVYPQSIAGSVYFNAAIKTWLSRYVQSCMQAKNQDGQ